MNLTLVDPYCGCWGKFDYEVHDGIEYLDDIKEFPPQFVDQVIFKKFKFEQIYLKIDDNDMKKTVDKKSEVDYNSDDIQQYLSNHDIMSAVRGSTQRLRKKILKHRSSSRNTEKHASSLFLRRNFRAATPALEPIVESNRQIPQINIRSILGHNESSIEDLSVERNIDPPREESKNNESSFSN